MKRNNNRSRFFSWATCLFASFTLIACSADETTVGKENGELLPVKVEAHIYEAGIGVTDFGKANINKANLSCAGTRAATSASTNSLSYYDVMGVYDWVKGASDTEEGIGKGEYIDNGYFVYLRGSWICYEDLVCKNRKSTHHFLAVLPRRTITNFAADPLTCNSNDNNDLLVGSASGSYNELDGTVSFALKHALARLVVKVNKRTDIADNWDTRVTINALSKGTIDYTTPFVPAEDDAEAQQVGTIAATVTADANSETPLRLFLASEADDHRSYTHELVMIPQTTNLDAISVDVYDALGNGHTYTPSSTELRLRPGMTTTVTINIGRDLLTLGNVTVTPWTTETFDGEVEEEEVTTP